MTKLADAWVQRLQSSDRDEALENLRLILLKALSSSFSSHPSADPALLEDFAQEALIKILANLAQFQGRSRFTTWAITIANRVALAELRRRKYKDVSMGALLPQDTIEFEFQDETLEQSEEKIAREQILAELRRATKTLSEHQRIVVKGKLAGLPIEVIAERTGRKRNAVYKSLHDARQNLQKTLLESGVTLTDVRELFH